MHLNIWRESRLRLLQIARDAYYDIKDKTTKREQEIKKNTNY